MNLLKRLDNGHFILKSFPGEYKPPYAILSHTWGDTDDEVTFQDIKSGTATSKPGYEKIKFCAEQIVNDNLEYIWVDTCCIDKTSGPELNEAIVSMFRWYQKAEKCYVYLSDVCCNGMNNVQTKKWMPDFMNCKWFTRGWTLQELIAPRDTMFFSRERVRLGNKFELGREISKITGISFEVLVGKKQLSEITYDEKVSWMECRQTQKEEDRAYSLQGIIGVHMLPHYGEGYLSAMDRLKTAFLTLRSPLRHTKNTHGRGEVARKATRNIRLADRCKKMRPLCRMYEPIVLLYSLVSPAEDYVPIALPTREETLYFPLRIARRKFLEDLAFLSDYDVGNDTVVAMAFQAHQQRQVLCIASNTSPTRRIVDFVQSRLVDIQMMSSTNDNHQTRGINEFVTACIEHAAPQIHESMFCLITAVHQCNIWLDKNHPEEIPGLLEWIGDCVYQPTTTDFCRKAYECQRSDYMNTLAKLSLQLRGQIDGNGSQNPFDLLRRHLTLLGRRFQAAKALLASAPRLPELSSGKVKINPLPTTSASRLPPADPLTIFSKIMGRMGSPSPRRDRCQQALAVMDVKHDLFHHFLHNYNSGNNKPCVHAEVQILDLFYTREYSFFEDDRFIACSRPACWSCSIYFTSHPGGVELSSSNRTICLNWRPPFVEDRFDMGIDQDRSKTMDEFNKRSRSEVMHQILKSSSIPSGHPGFPNIAPEANSLGQYRTSKMSYLEIMDPLKRLVRPYTQSVVATRAVAENGNIKNEVDGRQKQVDSQYLHEGLYESDSGGGVMLPTCRAT
ncbi:het domain protein [Stagonosporopsis vannaccii]|nr:het domain protein [Stagonosporopsis vannaccii]